LQAFARDSDIDVSDLKLLTRMQKNCLGRIYSRILPGPTIELLIEHKIPGPIFESLFAIAAVTDVWPHIASERQIWIEKMANEVVGWQPIIEARSFILHCQDWSKMPHLFVALFRPFVPFNADIFITAFEPAEVWRYIFCDEPFYLFLRGMMMQAANVPLPLQESIKKVKIGTGRGLDLAVFGRYIQLPLVCANYEQAAANARHLKPPLGMHFLFDRRCWETARKIYLRWLEHRDGLLYVFSIHTYTKLPNLIDYSWLGM